MKGLKHNSKKDAAEKSNYVMKNGILLGCHHGLSMKDLKYITENFKFFKIKKIYNLINEIAHCNYFLQINYIIRTMFV